MAEYLQGIHSGFPAGQSVDEIDMYNGQLACPADLFHLCADAGGTAVQKKDSAALTLEGGIQSGVVLDGGDDRTVQQAPAGLLMLQLIRHFHTLLIKQSGPNPQSVPLATL